MTWTGPGFVDHHTHLLRVAAGVKPCYDLAEAGSIAEFHRRVARAGSTPMDEPPEPIPVEDLPSALWAGLEQAAGAGLVEITEAGMNEWAYLDALKVLRDRDEPFPVRVRILVASGIADPAVMTRVDDPWLDVIGVKFYADGWLGPRTCALCEPFADASDDDDGVLFLDGLRLARRAEPFAEAGWTVATHAIGDRAVTEVLDAYEWVWGDDCAAAAPRIEHAQVLHPDLIDRMAALGVVACVQPSFAVSDAEAALAGLGPRRFEQAYRWDALLAAGVRVITGADYPIEPLEPLVGLQHLVTGAPLDGGDPVAATLPFADAFALMTDAGAGATVLADDPATVDPAELHRLEVLESRPSSSPRQ